MRFFTDHYFSEEQKIELLGDKYARAKHAVMQAEEAERCIAFEIALSKERLQRQQEEFDKGGRLVEMILLPLILTITLVGGMVSSYILDGMV